MGKRRSIHFLFHHFLFIPMSTLIIGLGNPLVSDDSVGLHVAAKLRERLADRPGVAVVEDYWGGLRLMEQMVGYDRVIVIDAICSGAPPGTIHHLAPGDMPTQRSASSHDMTLPTALTLGRQAGLRLPEDKAIVLVGIEAEDILSFGETCTPAVAAAVSPAAAYVLAVLDRSFVVPPVGGRVGRGGPARAGTANDVAAIDPLPQPEEAGDLLA